MTVIGVVGSGHPKYKFWKSASEKRNVYFIDIADANYFFDDLPKDQQSRICVFVSRRENPVRKRAEDNISAIREFIDMDDKSSVLVISNMDQLCEMLVSAKIGNDFRRLTYNEWTDLKNNILALMGDIKKSEINSIFCYSRDPYGAGICRLTAEFVDIMLYVNEETPFRSYEEVLEDITRVKNNV